MSADGKSGNRVVFEKVPGALANISGGTEALFWGLYGASGEGSSAQDCFWLDSASDDR